MSWSFASKVEIWVDSDSREIGGTPGVATVKRLISKSRHGSLGVGGAVGISWSFGSEFGVWHRKVECVSGRGLLSQNLSSKERDVAVRLIISMIAGVAAQHGSSMEAELGQERVVVDDEIIVSDITRNMVDIFVGVMSTLR